MNELTEAITKAAQTADLLVEDLRSIGERLSSGFTQDQIIAWNHVMELLTAASDLRNRVHRMAV